MGELLWRGPRCSIALHVLTGPCTPRLPRPVFPDGLATRTRGSFWVPHNSSASGFTTWTPASRHLARAIPEKLIHSRSDLCHHPALVARFSGSAKAGTESAQLEARHNRVHPEELPVHKKRSFSWLDEEAEDLIARAYVRHKTLATLGLPHAFPPSAEAPTTELEKLATPYHYKPQDFADKAAYKLMRLLRNFTHAFFREKYDHHAVTLETVAAVPGMVAAFHRHMRSLRTMRRDHGWITSLLEEAENERMHLLVFMKVTKPTFLERQIVRLAQAAYTLFYSLLYVFHPRAAHRLVGYLEEEAHFAYTQYLQAIDEGRIPNRPAPRIAVDYWRLREGATMRDVVLHVRADECMHRDTNHHLGDRYREGRMDEPPDAMKMKGGNEFAERKARALRWEDSVDSKD